jgi:2-aminoadipate transaminase
MTLVEIDIYSALRYRGESLPSLAELDPSANVIQVGSFSKIAFPGLRIGWVKARREVIARLAEAKQMVDLHSDQLSQAILVKFAESGKLEAHRRRVVENGRLQLAAVMDSLQREMPEGTQFTRPEGGMNLWITLPPPMDAAALLPEAQRAGVNYLPSRFFEIARRQPGSFRLSFGGLTPERIAQGVGLLGKVFRAEVPAAQPGFAMAMV